MREDAFLLFLTPRAHQNSLAYAGSSSKPAVVVQVCLTFHHSDVNLSASHSFIFPAPLRLPWEQGVIQDNLSEVS